MTQVKALDVSSHSGEVSEQGAREARADGVRLALVQAWGGLPDGTSGPNPHCRQQLATFRGADIIPTIYIVIPPDTTTDTSVLIRVAKGAAGDEYPHVRLAVPDIEDPQRRPLHPSTPDLRLADALGHLSDKPRAIYTSLSMWQGMMRGSMGFCHVPLWDASWDLGDQLDVNFASYGGWTERAALQYHNTIIRYGISCDLDVVDLERLGIAPALVPVENPYPMSLAMLAKRMTRIVAAFPLNQDQKGDAARETEEIAAWCDFYDREVAWRRPWFGRE